MVFACASGEQKDVQEQEKDMWQKFHVFVYKPFSDKNVRNLKCLPSLSDYFCPFIEKL